jgi:hypothetical protein
MSIFDDAQYKMMAKRGDRLKESQKKAKLDSLRPFYASYQGRDPNDGTDIVQTGANESTSGFRLISNAPMAIGDRVALRPNNSLSRVDAKNVAPSDEPIVLNMLLIDASLSFIIGNEIDTEVTIQSLPDIKLPKITQQRNSTFFTSAELRFLDISPTPFFNGFISYLNEGLNKRFEYSNTVSEYVLTAIHDGIFVADEAVIRELGIRGIRLRITMNDETYQYSFNWRRGDNGGFLGNKFICDCEQLIDLPDASIERPTVVNIFYTYSLF